MHLLSLFSILNAIYTFQRKRHYRLFESSVDVAPSTPSAHRVRVDSSPVSSSPLRFLSNIIAATTAESRAHPDATRDVWEVAVWDPLPVCLRLFCLFSPGHVLVYWLFLPTTALDPKPSVTVLTTIVLGQLLSIQLFVLQSNFSQQSKDTAVIHKEVLNEYDTKFVHPRMNPPVRDVGTQYSADPTQQDPLHPHMTNSSSNFVHTYTPVTVLNRGFKTHPNPNYSRHYDPDHASTEARTQHRPAHTTAAYHTPTYADLGSSPIRRNTTATAAMRQPQFRSHAGTTATTTASSGDGGSLGVYTHANSPLKKAASMNFRPTPYASDGGGGGGGVGGVGGYAARMAGAARREGSPLKKSTVPDGIGGGGGGRYAARWDGVGGAGRRDHDYF